MTVFPVIFWALSGLAGFALAARMFRRPADGPGVDAARISIVIPARNEAHNLPRLLRSVAAQDVKPLEVIVVDDASTDGTAGIAEAHGAKVIHAPALPEGWRGKTWALHHGARSAAGDTLIFMDADTWFEPGGLARVLGLYSKMEGRRPSLRGALSVVPYHAVEQPYEDLSMFFNLCMAAGTVPDGLSGQFLLVGREDLERAGGHASVRGKVLENFHLAENFRAAGITVRGLTGRGMVALRMYPEGFAALVEGWTKGFAAGAGRTSAGVMATVVAWMTALMLPPLLAWLAGDWRIGLATWLAGVAQLGWIARRIGSFGWASIVFHQVPLCFFFGMFAWSAMRSGRKVSWKGREIHAD